MLQQVYSLYKLQMIFILQATSTRTFKHSLAHWEFLSSLQLSAASLLCTAGRWAVACLTRAWQFHFLFIYECALSWCEVLSDSFRRRVRISQLLIMNFHADKWPCVKFGCTAGVKIQCSIFFLFFFIFVFKRSFLMVLVMGCKGGIGGSS